MVRVEMAMIYVYLEKTADTVAVSIKPVSSRQRGAYLWLPHIECVAQCIASHPAMLFMLVLHQLYVSHKCIFRHAQLMCILNKGCVQQPPWAKVKA